MLKLYWCPRTRASRALWMVEELGVDYELADIDIRDEVARADPEFRAASPMGKVPALVHDGARFADSAAICIYLADRFPEKRLAPRFDDPARGTYLYWMVFGPGVLEPALSEKFEQLAPNRVQHGWGDFPSMIETLERGLSKGPWLLGDRFSAADVMIGSSVHFMKVVGALPEREVFEAYVARCLARPAYRRAIEMDERAAPGTTGDGGA